MNASSTPILKDLVLIGGGHAHVTVIKQFAMLPVAGLRITLISPDVNTPYSGMLPGLIAGHYTYEEAHIDLQRLCSFASVVFIRGEVSGLDRDAKMIEVIGRPSVSYDLVSINAGSTPDPIAVPGAEGRVIPVKPVSEFLKSWDELKAAVLAKPDVRIGVIGGGAGGVELAMSTHFALQERLGTGGASCEPKFQVITGSRDILETHNAKVRAAYRKTLSARGIDVRTGFRVDRVDDTGVWSGEDHIALDHIMWVTGAAPPAWLAETGLDVDERGFLRLDETLRVTNDASVFAAGDNSGIQGHPRPKSGVFAVRQGPPLARNLRDAVLGKPLRRFQPQRAFLSLISTGDKNAVASWRGLTAQGAWVWRLKDWIDREFMDTFNDLPEMPTQPRPPNQRIEATAGQAALLGETDMRCGGCAAKIGAPAITTALADLPIQTRSDVVCGLDARDDAAVSRIGEGRLAVQSVDSFRAMFRDPYVLGMIAANHSLGDLFAMGAEPQTALSIVGLPHGLPAKNAALLRQILEGAITVFNAAGCQLTGGHTSESAELTVGFSLTGLAREPDLMRSAGLRPGDSLILTKPLGTGVVFAGDMRAEARGAWVFDAIETALVSNAKAAAIVRADNATAVTDVTGFGLAGHLSQIAAASGVSVIVKLDAIPDLHGALELLSGNFRSSLHAQNAVSASDGMTVDRAITDEDDLEALPEFQLLFDPQTAGGLLAGVPQDQADATLTSLRQAGYDRAAIIGHVTALQTSDRGAIHIEP